MGRADNVDKLVLDRTAADFSAAGSLAAAIIDSNAQTALVDCLDVDFVDVIVEFTNLGTGPVSAVNIVGRGSGIAAPDVSTGADWSTINTESVDTTTGISTIVPYVGQVAVGSVGRYMVSFPTRGRYFSALVSAGLCRPNLNGTNARQQGAYPLPAPSPRPRSLRSRRTEHEPASDRTGYLV